MAAPTLGSLVTRMPASVTRGPRSIAKVILYSLSPQSVKGHGTCVSNGAYPPPLMWRARVRGYVTRGNTGAHRWGWPRSGATRRMATLEPFPCWKAGSKALGHAAMPEWGGLGLAPWGVWLHVDACSAPCLDLKPVCRVPTVVLRIKVTTRQAYRQMILLLYSLTSVTYL
jgi:hypothetical protein